MKWKRRGRQVCVIWPLISRGEAKRYVDISGPAIILNTRGFGRLVYTGVQGYISVDLHGHDQYSSMQTRTHKSTTQSFNHK